MKKRTPPPPVGGRSREARERGRRSRPTEGLTLLEQRIAEIPDALRRTAALPDPCLRAGLEGAHGVVTTGVGSSRAQARLLAHLLADRAGVPARFVPLGALASQPPARAAAEILVVFSQGLSPSSWLPLGPSSSWRRIVFVTAVTEASGQRARRLSELERLGADVVRIAGEDEFGLLFRVIGPVCATLAAFRLARRLAEALDGEALPDVEVATILEAMDRAVRRVPRVGEGELDENLVFVASGGYAELADNLRLKVLESLLAPMPAAWDLVDFAHGPFQQLAAKPATLIVLERRDAAGEPALLARLETMLDPGRHHLIRLTAELPGALALFEHEAQLNELVRRALAERGGDPSRWPGQGRAGPLYDVARLPPAAVPTLASSTWPEIERALAAGKTTLVVPLGATEQHGPHLPLATDALIAGELAERLCRRFPDAIAAPVLAVGCSSEHGAFPGTLSLTPETLERVLADLLEPLHRHGFRRAFFFSAHGGNVAALREMLPRLRASAAPLEVVLFGELDSLAEGLHAESAKFGISAEASGHHAGELETSILLALRPGAVRAERLEPGFVEPTRDAQSIFYPSLRERSPSGVVGDPREADAGRAEAYLEAWVDRLAAAYRG